MSEYETAAVGIIKTKLAMRNCRSLKEKRSIVRSLKDIIRNQYNVSIAEIGAQDVRQLAVIAIAQAGADTRHVRRSLDKIVDMLRDFNGAQIIEYKVEIFHQ